VARAKMSLETMLMLGMLKTFRKRGDEGSTVALLNWVVHDIEHVDSAQRRDLDLLRRGLWTDAGRCTVSASDPRRACVT
jgi:hypothetical protein